MRWAGPVLFGLLTVSSGARLEPCATRALMALQQPPAPQAQQVPRHTERVEVSRVLIDARVVDDFGQPIRGLGPNDFKVKIDGKPARVESAFWVGADEAAGDASSALPGPVAPVAPEPIAPIPPEARGRLVVFLFQKDLEPSRIVGLMRMLIESQKFLEAFGPDDRIAVLSFDYKLKIWLDFTRDRDKVRDLMESILKKNPPPIQPSVSPSLMTTLDVVKANRAYSMEQALALLGQALEPLPGSKSVVLVGHGFGRLSGSAVYFEAEYGEARRALQAARASVFCLDVTDADSHTLEAGLEMTAEDTGGFFVRTNIFTGLAMKRLAGALAGHYVLFVEVGTPSGKRWHDIEVELAGRSGNVLAKRHYQAPS